MRSISSFLIKKLLLLILKCNTFIFNNHFLHQIVGATMGTPVVGNFAKRFMAKFEKQIFDYKKNYWKEIGFIAVYRQYFYCVVT